MAQAPLELRVLPARPVLLERLVQPDLPGPPERPDRLALQEQKARMVQSALPDPTVRQDRSGLLAQPGRPDPRVRWELPGRRDLLVPPARSV